MPLKHSVEMHICHLGLALVLLLVILDGWQRLIFVPVMVVMLPVTHTAVAKVWLKLLGLFSTSSVKICVRKYSSSFLLLFKSQGLKKIETFFREYQLILAVDATMQEPFIICSEWVH
jgi:hypothetical protein